MWRKISNEYKIGDTDFWKIRNKRISWMNLATVHYVIFCCTYLINLDTFETGYIQFSVFWCKWFHAKKKKKKEIEFWIVIIRDVISRICFHIKILRDNMFPLYKAACFHWTIWNHKPPSTCRKWCKFRELM